MWWIFSDLARLKAEREQIAALASRKDWLEIEDWRIDKGKYLVVDAILTVADHSYAVALRYPESFPHSPPSVLPRGDDSRWSSHQYGSGGELCLEFRADNWMPDIMGYQLLESTYRLLSGENPSPGRRARVAAAHRLTEGQALRSTYERLVLTSRIKEKFQALADDESASGRIVMQMRKLCTSYVILSLTFSDGSTFADTAVPANLGKVGFEFEIFVRRIAANAALPDKNSQVALKAALGCPDVNFAIVLQGTAIHAFYFFSSDDVVSEISVIGPEPEKLRLSVDHQRLADRQVAIVGCGSLGSKISIMLGRSGVERFLLVDDDILLPGNLVRNEFDWRDVGFHKTDSAATKLELVRPSVKATIRRIQLGGQESATSADTILVALAKCDLVIDATANPVAQNLIFAAVGSKKPVVWAEVFAGGGGGLIARCRPSLEPSIPLMRRAIENWFADRDAAPMQAGQNYDLVGAGEPQIADDADVTAIASAAARLAIDCLLERSPSFFPHSIYALGLAPSGVFSQAFETFPIEYGPVEEEAEGPALSPEKSKEEFAFLLSLYDKDKACSD